MAGDFWLVASVAAFGVQSGLELLIASVAVEVDWDGIAVAPRLCPTAGVVLGAKDQREALLGTGTAKHAYKWLRWNTFFVLINDHFF